MQISTVEQQQKRLSMPMLLLLLFKNKYCMYVVSVVQIVLLLLPLLSLAAKLIVFLRLEFISKLKKKNKTIKRKIQTNDINDKKIEVKLTLVYKNTMKVIVWQQQFCFAHSFCFFLILQTNRKSKS